MYLRTPKRYTAKGKRRKLINLRWLWLYLLAPLIIIPSVLVWQYRDLIGAQIGDWAREHVVLNPPTPTATIPAQDYQQLLGDAFRSGRLDKATTLLKSFTEIVPNNVSVHSLLAQLIVLRKAYVPNPDPALLEDAYQAGQRAINADPEAPEGWTAMALVLDYSAKPKEALPYALRAKDLDTDSKYPMIQAVLAEIYFDLGKNDLAEKLVDDAIAKAKTTTPLDRAALTHAHYVKARILEVTSADGNDSIKEYEEAWRVATSDPPDLTIPTGYIVQFLNFAYSNTNQVSRAIDLVSKAIERDRDDPLLDYFLSRLYFNQGDPNKARLYADSCHDLNPNEPRCLRMLARLYFREQNYKKAAEIYQQLVDQGSKESNDYLNGGAAYRYSNQCGSSITILQQGVALVQDAKDRADFEDALRACGSTSGFDIETPTATAVATEPPVATKPAPAKKR